MSIGLAWEPVNVARVVAGTALVAVAGLESGGAEEFLEVTVEFAEKLVHIDDIVR